MNGMENNQKKRMGIIQICIALLFLLVALLVLAELIGWFKTETAFGIYWPVVLIFVGLITMSPKNAQSNGFSFGLSSLGLLLLLRNMGVFNSQTGKVALIALLALCGIGVLAFATSKKPPSKPNSNNSDDLYF